MRVVMLNMWEKIIYGGKYVHNPLTGDAFQRGYDYNLSSSLKNVNQESGVKS